MIPRGDTFNVTFWSFFPLALAWTEDKKKGESVTGEEGGQVRK